MPRWRIVEEQAKYGTEFFVEERKKFLWWHYWSRLMWPNEKCGYRAFGTLLAAKRYIDGEIQERIKLADAILLERNLPIITEYCPQCQNNKTITR